MENPNLQSDVKQIDTGEYQLKTKPQSFTLLTLRQMSKNKGAMLCAAFLLFMILIAIFAPFVAPYDPLEIHPIDSMKPPDENYLFGTDEVGRDILSRVIFGARISLRVGFISAAISTGLGLILGLTAGFYGGAIGFIILRIMDLFLAFPGILLALVVVAILGPGIEQVMIAVGVAQVPTFVRVVYGAVLSCKENEYVTAAVMSGSKDLRIVLRYILPNIMAPIIVMSTLYVASGIFSASSLSFLGLGAQPPSPEWGAMVSRGRHNLRLAPWMSTYPGLAIALVVVSINIVGDALRDALDPWIRAR